LPLRHSCGNVSSMTEASQTKTTAQLVERDQKALIVDRLYDVAMDPIRLEDLLDVWEGSVAPLRVGPLDKAIELDDPDIAAHLQRASVFLERTEAAHPDHAQRSVLREIPRAAAFLTDGGALITACNRAAGIAFRVRDGGAISALPFDGREGSDPAHPLVDHRQSGHCPGQRSGK
jgi:hypothetical protein